MNREARRSGSGRHERGRKFSSGGRWKNLHTSGSHNAAAVCCDGLLGPSPLEKELEYFIRRMNDKSIRMPRRFVHRYGGDRLPCLDFDRGDSCLAERLIYLQQFPEHRLRILAAQKKPEWTPARESVVRDRDVLARELVLKDPSLIVVGKLAEDSFKRQRLGHENPAGRALLQ
jgi:hypothetical protein